MASSSVVSVASRVLSHLLVAVIALQLGLVYRVQRGEERGLASCPPHGGNRLVSPPKVLLSTSRRRRSGPPPGVPSTLTQTVVGAATSNVFEFLDTFRFGFSNFAMQKVDTANFTRGNQHVLFLYQHPMSVPSSVEEQRGLSSVLGNANVTKTPLALPVRNVSIADATRRCRVVKHLLTNSGINHDRNGRSCTAVVGQHLDSYHVSKWMKDVNNTRVTARGFRRVNRYEFVTEWTLFNGLLRIVPTQRQSQDALKILREYLTALDDAIETLRPIADKVANAGSPAVRGTIIVLVCNFGHAELFVNFVCVARANGVDISKMLLFATDDETYELATALGIAAFHDARIFASIPRNASALYGNEQYAKIMMSKVYCVHMVSMLGYNFLFQDVDIMIYKPNYLEWFIEKAKSENYDIFFQHDFNDRAEYAPWVSNSGCYYAVNNEMTKQLFAEMVHQGDLVSSSHSHQATMHTVLSELTSRHGLRVKNLRDDHEKFPIGWHFQQNKGFMRNMIEHGKSKQLSFHMNWNSHKDVKRQYFEQMGDWYLLPACANATSWEAMKLATSGAPSLMAACCSIDPLIRCNWRDKPSVIPCRDSPAANANRPASFW